MTETKIEYTHPSSLAHIAMPEVAKIAAQQMGLDVEAIVLTAYSCRQNPLTPPAPALDADGQPIPQTLTPEDLFSYTYTTTWIPRAETEKPAEPVLGQEPVPPIPWPMVELPRGARWHGIVQLTPDTVGEVELISDGITLFRMDSPEGQEVLADHHVAPDADPA